jgi:hypothetical protein
MLRPILFGAGALALLLAIAGWWAAESSSPETLFDPNIKPVPSVPLCPWREPEADLQRFFPDATHYEVETRILSGVRVELAERLRRVPSGDENALRLHRVYRDKRAVGTVLTRRVKGGHGAIELILAVDGQARVRGLRLQRLREPEFIVDALQNPAWLQAFQGKNAESLWQLGGDLPEVPAEARTSAEAIVQGARSLLILLAAAGQGDLHRQAAPASH